jgi:PAS domain S-box-containing protein
VMHDPLPQKIEPTQTFFESFFEFWPDAIVVTDENGRITNVNSQVERAFGYTRAELLGLPVEPSYQSDSEPHIPATETATAPTQAFARWARS